MNINNMSVSSWATAEENVVGPDTENLLRIKLNYVLLSERHGREKARDLIAQKMDEADIESVLNS